MAAAGRPQHPAKRTGRCGREHPQKETDKSKLRYFLRYSQTPAFKPETTVQAETRWPFFNPKQDLAPGTWYWQYGYVTDGKTEWSDTLQFTVKNNPRKFCPPALDAVLKNLPAHHPRVWLDRDEWDGFIKRSEGKAERKTYLKRADKVLATPMKSVNDINSDLAKGLANEMQKMPCSPAKAAASSTAKKRIPTYLSAPTCSPKTAAMPTKP